MNRFKKLASFTTAVLVAGSLMAASASAANNTFGIDEINWTAEDWASIAMTNDDTVETGAVIRKEANADSEAAGYLYRGAAVKVVDKGEEWTEVQSGKVSGYVKNEFLTFGEEAKGLAAHYGEQGVVANWNDVNVFSRKDGGASVAGTVDNGTVLGMVQDNGHWIAVQQGADSAGYVSEEDVTRVLLVDTAVPAEGEDDADVVVTMTAEDLDSSEAAPAQEASYEEVSEDAGSYEEAYDSSNSYSEDTWTQDSYEAAPEEDYTTIKTVSDDPTIQALYEAYMAAQNAAMNCTSAEDAQAKADAAVAAWNAYIAACNGTTPVQASSTDTASYDSSSAENYDTEEEEDEDYSDETYSDDEDWYDEEDDEEDEYYDDETDTSVEDTTSDAVAAASANSSGLYGGASDLDLLAAIIWCEAGNQSYDGMVAVGQVVMNRVKSGSFPNTIAEVLNQPGQFTPSSSGTLQAAINAGVNSTCYAAASDALNGASPVPGTPLYFNTHSGSYQLGAHYFS